MCLLLVYKPCSNAHWLFRQKHIQIFRHTKTCTHFRIFIVAFGILLLLLYHHFLVDAIVFFLFSCVCFIFSVDMHVPYSWLLFFFLLSLNTAPDGRYCQLNLHVKLMRSCWLLRINSFYHFLFDIFDDCYYRHCTIAIAATFPIYAMVTIHAFSWNICFVAHLLLAYKHISKCKKWITLASLSQCIARTHTLIYINTYIY